MEKCTLSKWRDQIETKNQCKKKFSIFAFSLIVILVYDIGEVFETKKIKRSINRVSIYYTYPFCCLSCNIDLRHATTPEIYSPRGHNDHLILAIRQISAARLLLLSLLAPPLGIHAREAQLTGKCAPEQACVSPVVIRALDTFSNRL